MGRPDLHETVENDALTSPRAFNGLTPSVSQSRVADTGPDSLKSLVHSVRLEAERSAIAAALQKTGWNRKGAARLLKISYRTLLYKIDQYQIKASDLSLLPGDTGLSSKGNGTRKNTRAD